MSTCGSISPEPAAGILFVDLDGTLIATDIFGECLIRGCTSSLKNFRKLVLAAFKGRATLKHATAQLVMPNVKNLPFRPAVLRLLEERRAAGWVIILATATDKIWAQLIVDHLEVFDDMLASDGVCNLKGTHKLAAIRLYCQEHGFQDFAYVGDSMSDFPIWIAASEAHVVPRSLGVTERLRRTHDAVEIIGKPPRTTAAIWRTLRPWQWLKNTLVLVPLILGHEFNRTDAVLDALIAMIAMCMCASAVYILNDLLDIEADRMHPKKRFRPLAAGKLGLSTAVALLAGLNITGFLLALTTLPLGFSVMLSAYVSLSVVYAVWLKREAMADVIVLAGLYTIRLYAGGIAVNVAVSDWLFTLSVFLFTSLAFAKRHAELMRLESEGLFRACGRGYIVTDLPLIRALGPCSGYLSVLVFALYTQSESTRAMYPNSEALWLICPLALFWVSRLWLIAIRGMLQEDPVVFALRDRVSLVMGVVVGILLVLAAGEAGELTP